MKSLAHHKPTRDLAKGLAHEQILLGTCVDNLPENLQNLGLGARDGEACLGLALQQGADRAVALRALRFARDAALGMFKAGQEPPGETVIELDGHRFPVPHFGSRFDLTTTHWDIAFFASLILRDNATSEWLALFPLQSIRDSPIEGAEFGYTAVDALQGFRLDEHGWQTTLKRAMAQAAADREFGHYGPELDFPMLRVLDKIYSGADPFNDALFDALKSHQRYYTRGHKCNTPEGFVSLPLLGLASWAHDCRVPLEVESPYIPRWLVEHDLR